ncbi:hypothetical protein HYC85_009243 [Camellia sinensis]|uniref:Uncharacterized protein n=1 Tax=Camellia sinensis TaxID=4442 RepID=A0A7J7HF32_CAMSI|nr:hypothetical protein HYC85_009243 [Camellia sinensis]
MAEEEDVLDWNPRFFVVVHIGAGFHAPSNEKALRSAMKRACLATASVLCKALKIYFVLDVDCLECLKWYPSCCFVGQGKNVGVSTAGSNTSHVHVCGQNPSVFLCRQVYRRLMK